MKKKHNKQQISKKLFYLYENLHMSEKKILKINEDNVTGMDVLRDKLDTSYSPNVINRDSKSTPKPGGDTFSGLRAAELSKLPPKEIRKGEKEGVLYDTITLPKPEDEFDSARARRTVDNYRDDEGKLIFLADALLKKVKPVNQAGIAKIEKVSDDTLPPKQKDFLRDKYNIDKFFDEKNNAVNVYPDIIHIANVHALQIASKGRATNFTFHDFTRPDELEGLYVTGEGGEKTLNKEFKPKNINDTAQHYLSFKSYREYFEYILEVLVLAYKGKTTFDNGSIYVTKNKEGEKGQGLEKINSKVVIDVNKSDILATIAAFFTVSPKTKAALAAEEGKDFVSSALENYLYKVIERNTSKRFSVQSMKQNTPEDEQKDAVMFAWMKQFGSVDRYEEKLKETVDVDTSKEEAQKTKALLEKDETKGLTSRSFFYFNLESMGKGIITYFQIRNRLAKLMTSSSQMEVPDESDETIDKLFNTHPELIEDFNKANQQIYEYIIVQKGADSKIAKAFKGIVIDKISSTQLFVNELKSVMLNYEDSIAAMNLVPLKSVTNADEFNRAMSDADKTESIKPITNLAEIKGITIEHDSKTNYIKKLENIAKKYNLILTDVTDAAGALDSFLSGAKVKAAISAIYMSYPGFFVEKTKKDPETGKYFTKKYLAINIKNIVQIARLSKEKASDSEFNYDYQSFRKKQRDVESGINPNMSLEDFFNRVDVDLNKIIYQTIPGEVKLTSRATLELMLSKEKQEIKDKISDFYKNKYGSTLDDDMLERLYKKYAIWKSKPENRKEIEVAIAKAKEAQRLYEAIIARVVSRLKKALNG